MSASPEIIITVRDLKIGYGEKIILQNVNFQVRRGEVFVILGGSGCGKSTLLKNLIGLYTPLAGEMWIEEDNLIAAKGRRTAAVAPQVWRDVSERRVVRLDDRS